MNMNSAIVHPYDIELEHLNVADPAIFQAGREEAYFRRLRDEAPLHYCQDSAFGPYWSVTRYADIMAVDTDHARFSSAGGITVGGAGGTPMPPRQNQSNKARSPVRNSMVLVCSLPWIRQSMTCSERQSPVSLRQGI